MHYARFMESIDLLNTFSKIISIVINPLLVAPLSFAILIYLDASLEMKHIFFSISVLFTNILPLITIYNFIRLGKISSFDPPLKEQRIELLAIAAIENGYIENEITRSAYEYQRQVEEKERLIVGINIHEKEDLSEQHIQYIDSKKVEIHINRLKDLKKNRNNLEVESSLSTLKRIAKTDENIMPQIINCVKSKCTLGEISDALRKVYGEY